MTGIKLRYDTKKGKIRRLKINCREPFYTRAEGGRGGGIGGAGF